MTDLTVIRSYAIACGVSVDRARDAYDAACARLIATREEFDRLAFENAPRATLEAANDALVTARLEAAVAAARTNEAIKYAERVAIYAAQAMGGDVDAEGMATFAAAVRALVGPCLSLEPEAAA